MSTAKPNPLRQAMLAVQASPHVVPLVTEPATKAPATDVRTARITPARIGKKAIGGHFNPEAAKQLRMMAAEGDRTVQDLLEEALNDLFRKHNKSAIA